MARENNEGIRIMTSLNAENNRILITTKKPNSFRIKLFNCKSSQRQNNYQRT